ncbi:hypothetical protein KR018_008787, partial [Drosophila ironensis]
HPVTVNPGKRFRDLSKYINRWTDLLGVDVLASQLKLNYRTWTTSFAICNYTVFTLYTIADNGGEWISSLKCSLMMGGLVHGVGKFLTCLLRQKEMRQLTFYASAIYDEYESRGKSYYSALNANIDRYLGIMRVIRTGYFCSFLLLVATPLCMLIYNGTRETMMLYAFPGLPLENNIAYAITYMLQLVTIGVSGFGFYAGDLYVLLGLAQISTFSDILQLKILELNAVLEEKSQKRAVLPVGGQIPGEEERVHLVMDVIKWHQEFTEYCRNVHDLYHPLIATQVLSMAFSIMISFCINLNSFHLPSAVTLVQAAYCMSVYCIMGTKIEFTYDQVFESICNVPWYELNGGQRKMFCLVLRGAQDPPTIKMLGIMALSGRTALQVISL